MRRSVAIGLLTAAAVLVLGAGIAPAAEIEVAPADPDPGSQELTIEAAGFEADTAVYAVPCTVPDSGSAEDITPDDCDITSVVTATTDADGRATFVVTWDIPDVGLAVFVGDEMRTDQATVILGDAVPAADPDTPAGDDPQVEVLGTTVDESELADTGADTDVLLLVAAALIGIGLLTMDAGRRAGRRTLPVR